MVSFQTTASKYKFNAMASLTQHKYYLLFFMHSNEIGLLIPFAKINKRGVLLRYEGAGKKSKN